MSTANNRQECRIATVAGSCPTREFVTRLTGQSRRQTGHPDGWEAESRSGAEAGRQGTDDPTRHETGT